MKKGILAIMLFAAFSAFGLCCESTNMIKKRNHPVGAFQTQKSADNLAAEYLFQKSNEGIEQYIVVLTSQNRIVNITKNASAMNVDYDSHALSELAANENLMIGYHNHFQSLEEYIKYLEDAKKSKAEIKYVKKLPAGLFHRRLMLEAPSAPNDMWAALGKQFLYTRANLDGILEERILVSMPNQQVRIVSYGLQEDKQRIYKGLLLRYFKAFDDLDKFLHSKGQLEKDNMLTAPDMPYEEDNVQKHDSLESKLLDKVRGTGDELAVKHALFLGSYTNMKKKYEHERCRPEERGQCVEPSFEEFAKQVNDAGVWFLKDLGYITPKDK